MTGVCLAIPGWIGSPGHLWTPAAGADREPKTTVATLTSTCSLPTAARLCQTEINYPGESYCTAEHGYIRLTVLSQAHLYFFKYKRHSSVSFSINRIVPSLDQCHFHIISHPLTFFLLTYQSLLFFLASLPFFFLLPVISFSLWNNIICGVAKITSAFYIFHCVFSFFPSLYVLSITPKGKEKRNLKEICLWLTFSRGIATFPRKSALLSRSSS